MKKIAVLVGLLLCTVLALAACGGEKDAAPKEETAKAPDEVVKEYFAYWANKDKASMDRLVIESQRSEEDDPDVTLVTSLTLNSCMLVTDEMKDEWDPELYADPYDFAYVDVDFDITFEGGEGAGYSDGNEQTRFYLIKETEGSPWKIVTWGVG